MTDEQPKPGRSVRRHARPVQPEPEPPWPGDGAGAPARPEGWPAGSGQPSGYGQPAAVNWGPDAEGTVPGGYGRSPGGPVAGGYGQRSTPARAALPPGGRHAGQGAGPDRPGASYQGSRRSAQPNGPQPGGTQPNGTQPNGTQPNGTQPNGTQPNGTRPGAWAAGEQRRPDPLTDPSYAQHSGPGQRDGRYQRDDAGQGDAGYQRQAGYPRGGGSRDGGSRDGGSRDGGSRGGGSRDGRPDDGPRDGQSGRAGLYRPAAYQPGEPAGSDAAYPPGGPAQRDGRYADPRAPRGQRHRNVPPEPADPGSHQDRPGPDERGAYQGRRQRNVPPGPDERGAYQGRRQRNVPPGPDEPGSYQDRRPQDLPPGPAERGPYEGRRQRNVPPGPDEPGSYQDRRPQDLPPGPAERGPYEGRRQRNVPPGPNEPGSYQDRPGLDERGARQGRRQRNVPPEPAEPGAYRGRRSRDEPPGPDGPAGPGGPGGPPWQDSRNDGYEEDDRFVPGLGGPRHHDDEDGYDDGYGDDGDGGGRRRGRGSGGGGRKRRRLRWIAPLVAVAVILTPLIIGGVYVYGLYMSKYHPADYTGGGTGQAIVQVQSGQTATQVGQRLVTLGVVKSLRAFELAAEHSTDSRGLEPGFYRMHKQMQATLAFALLLNPAARIEDKITIPEGWRLTQIETALAAKSGIPMADYQQALASPGSLGLPGFANGNAEGYLFPATYNVQPNMTATTVLQTMVNRFSQEAVNINLNAAAAQAHMTPGQVITVASLLQAEGGQVSDYPKIARVVLNRLQVNMPLQFDSTVFYGLHLYGTSATIAQTHINTPYNTYMRKGLPPGPIDSPGNAAIEAALHPAAGNWLYFVSGTNGVTTFYQTLPK